LDLDDPSPKEENDGLLMETNEDRRVAVGVVGEEGDEATGVYRDMAEV